MNLHLVQFDLQWEDKPASQARADELISAAEIPPGGLIVLPELGDTGFSFDLDAIVDERSAVWARELATRTGCWVQHGWACRLESGRGRNVAGLFSPDGTLLGKADKLHPFSVGREHEVYDGGDVLTMFDLGETCVAPLTCYDLRFPEAFRKAAIEGAEVFTVGASWPQSRMHHWRALAIARAIENQAAVVAANRTGDDPNLRYIGGSMIISHDGEVLAEAGDEETVLSATIDLPELRRWRRRFPCLRDARADLQGPLEVRRLPH
ncbi:MAG: hypothetical protein MK101_09465 [Phycisphaerales bacterium]|nr:hypothetical protein [Phycisphaerales bacterium]